MITEKKIIQDLEKSPNFSEWYFRWKEIVWSTNTRYIKNKASPVVANHFFLVYISFLLSVFFPFYPLLN
jgi:hypothetical protein